VNARLYRSPWFCCNKAVGYDPRTKMND
jgi:hypothetical protein